MLTGKAKTDYQREYMRRRRAGSENGVFDMQVLSNEGYIYVIHCDGSTYYKVGITRNNAEGRVQSFQTGCPYKLRLVMMFRSNEIEDLEARIHTQFADRNVIGEWFDLDPQAFCDLIIAINPMMIGYIRPSKV